MIRKYQSPYFSADWGPAIHSSFLLNADFSHSLDEARPLELGEASCENGAILQKKNFSSIEEKADPLSFFSTEEAAAEVAELVPDKRLCEVIRQNSQQLNEWFNKEIQQNQSASLLQEKQANLFRENGKVKPELFQKEDIREKRAYSLKKEFPKKLEPTLDDQQPNQNHHEQRPILSADFDLTQGKESASLGKSGSGLLKSAPMLVEPTNLPFFKSISEHPATFQNETIPEHVPEMLPIQETWSIKKTDDFSSFRKEATPNLEVHFSKEQEILERSKAPTQHASPLFLTPDLEKEAKKTVPQKEVHPIEKEYVGAVLSKDELLEKEKKTIISNSSPSSFYSRDEKEPKASQIKNTADSSDSQKIDSSIREILPLEKEDKKEEMLLADDQTRYGAPPPPLQAVNTWPVNQTKQAIPLSLEKAAELKKPFAKQAKQAEQPPAMIFTPAVYEGSQQELLKDENSQRSEMSFLDTKGLSFKKQEDASSPIPSFVQNAPAFIQTEKVASDFFKKQEDASSPIPPFVQNTPAFIQTEKVASNFKSLEKQKVESPSIFSDQAVQRPKMTSQMEPPSLLKDPASPTANHERGSEISTTDFFQNDAHTHQQPQQDPLEKENPSVETTTRARTENPVASTVPAPALTPSSFMQTPVFVTPFASAFGVQDNILSLLSETVTRLQSTEDSNIQNVRIQLRNDYLPSTSIDILYDMQGQLIVHFQTAANNTAEFIRSILPDLQQKLALRLAGVSCQLEVSVVDEKETFAEYVKDEFLGNKHHQNPHQEDLESDA